MHTEAEAIKLWCPMVRAAPNGVNAFKLTTERVGACAGSNCMMWRWGYKPNPDHHPTEMWSGVIHRSEPYITDNERGYCGLAGRPS
jgi:hypothetical protein